MKKMFIIMCVCFMFSFISCTDSQRASLSAFGDECTITMYNGGIMVRQWVSTGKVTTIHNSDGWQFKDKKTGKLVRISGDAIIEVN